MKKGFTLIEILIVIGIGAVLLGIGALSLGGLRSGRRPDLEARQLVAALENAQEKSIGQDNDSRWGVYFDTAPDRDTYYLYQVNEELKSSSTYNGIPGTVIDRHTLSTEIQIVFLNSSVTSSLIFAKANGQPTATTTIMITSGDDQTAKQITINAQGKIDYE